MIIHRSARLGLLSTSALGALAAAVMLGAPAVASAQAAAAAQPSLLGEVVVTATRREDTLNRVPLSISAQTQQTLDAQGIRTITDLSRVTPALTVRPINNAGFGSGSNNLTLRGVYSGAGSQTVGVYLDDVPLTQRIAPGLSGNGTPIPQLFDLERVEVLRGPQGTLYGGSSEGGAVRFITPTPSLTKLSAYARAEGSQTKDGSPSGEVGLAVGGPIVQDKLGFRVSADIAHTGGYIDRVKANTGALVEKDANWKERSYIRGVLLWKPSEDLKIMPGVYLSKSYSHDDDHFWANVPAYTLPAQTFFANGQPGGPPPTYTRAAQNYPAATWFGPYKNGDQATSPRRDTLNIYSLDINYNLGFADFKSLSSYIDGHTKGSQFQNFDLIPLVPIWGGYYSADPAFAPFFPYTTHRTSITQEVRLTSKNDSRFTWVLGAFYQHTKSVVTGYGYENFDAAILPSLRGVSSQAFYGINEASIGYTHLGTDKTLTDNSLAAFGDGTYALTDKLKITAGVRVSKETFNFNTCAFGVELGVRTCTVATGTQVNGTQKSSPILPKIGLTYELAENKMVYATASRGFRNGGVNQPVPQNANCQFGLAQVGGSRPATYEPDYVTSYEAGGKLRLFGGHAQVNASAFRIDWTSLQQVVSLPRCPFDYVTNVGAARSQGFDLSSQMRLFEGFTVDVNVAYTDAQYTETAGPRNAAGAITRVIVTKGDKLPVAPWTVSVAGDYKFAVRSDVMGYVRADYEYQSDFHRTPGPAAVGYAPDIYNAPSASITNARLGLVKDTIDVSLFVKNIFNSQDKLLEFGGRTGCSDLACTTAAATDLTRKIITYRPREIGLTATYRY